MLETGDLIDIRLQEAPRHKKPAGIYWLQAGSASVLGGEDAPIWAYRLPSLVAAILASVLTAWAVLPLVGREASLAAGGLTAMAVMLAVEAHLAKTDAVLLLTIVVAQGALARLTFGRGPPSRTMAALFWVAQAVGVLVKGPITPLVSALTLAWVAFGERRFAPFKRLHAAWGVPLFLALVAPWFIAIGVVTEGAFYMESIGRDLLGKVATGQESHGAPPGYYLATVWGTFWPAAALIIPAAPLIWAWQGHPAVRFLLGWALPIWLVFELVSTKLPHYTLPAFPALAALIAFALYRMAADWGRPNGPRRWATAILFALPAGALPLAGALGPLVVEGGFSLIGLLAAPIGLLAAWLGVRTILEARPHATLLAMALAAVATYGGVLGGAIPSLSSVFPSPRMAEAAAPFDSCRTGPLATVGYREPSFIFATETATRLIDAEQAGRELAEGSLQMVWVMDRLRPAFDEGTQLAQDSIRELAAVEGFNYNRGKPFTTRLLARSGDPSLDGCLP
jgi:4-amino-4-deoxy-L-arabinose transferase-like glycosyltransferase